MAKLKDIIGQESKDILLSFVEENPKEKKVKQAKTKRLSASSKPHEPSLHIEHKKNQKQKFQDLPKSVRKAINEKNRKKKIYERWLASGKSDFYKPVWLKEKKPKHMTAKNKNLQSSSPIQYTGWVKVVSIPMGGQNKRY